jgi:hypothetical protein
MESYPDNPGHAFLTPRGELTYVGFAAAADYTKKVMDPEAAQAIIAAAAQEFPNHHEYYTNPGAEEGGAFSPQ